MLPDHSYETAEYVLMRIIILGPRIVYSKVRLPLEPTLNLITLVIYKSLATLPETIVAAPTLSTFSIELVHVRWILCAGDFPAVSTVFSPCDVLS